MIPLRAWLYLRLIAHKKSEEDLAESIRRADALVAVIKERGETPPRKALPPPEDML